jgi:hypothetical protein
LIDPQTVTRVFFSSKGDRMAKGYTVDEEQRCIRFRIPAVNRNVIKCTISFDTLAESFGAKLSSRAEDIFEQNRTSIEHIAKRLIFGGRPVDANGWVWIRPADC